MKKLFLSVLSFITALGAGLIILIEDRRAQDGDISWFDYSKNKSIHLWQSLQQFVCSFFWSHNHPPTTNQKTTPHKESNTNAPRQQKPKQNKKIYFPAIINSAKKPTTIAAISYINAPCVQQIVSGFAGQLYKDFGEHYQLKHYSAQSNPEHMTGILNHMINNPHALIFSLGVVSTLSLKQLYDAKKIQTPSLFAGVKEPAEVGIIKNYQLPEGFLTGVVESEHNYQEQVDFINFIKPTMKRALICFDPYRNWIINSSEKLRIILEKKSNIEKVIVRKYTSKEDFERNILQPINGGLIDTVFTMQDILPTTMLDALVRICNKKHVTLYASDSASLSRGVGLAYGHNEKKLGIFAGIQAFDILHKQMPIQNIPVIQMRPENKIWINPLTIKQQGIPNADVLLALFNHGKMYEL